jgi:hypothetical protein
MSIKHLKIILLVLFLLIFTSRITAQDTLKTQSTRKVTIGGIFLSLGGGIDIPVGSFKDNSNVTFGILGRLEYTSTTIFPFVIGGEIDYFSHKGADDFITRNLLNAFDTRILSAGLNVEIVLSKFIRTPYTTLFLTLDVKTNFISREYDENKTIENMPLKDTKISIGAGAGFTVFIFDFYCKYNYMKDLSNIGVYTKLKIPVIRF